MNIANLPDDSESSDEDYVPDGASAELPSEEESDGDPEDGLPSQESTGRSKRRKRGRAPKKKKAPPVEEPPAEDPKKKQDTNALWADFMKDTGFKTKAERLQLQPTIGTEETKPETSKQHISGPPKKVKVTEVLKFAGEEVKIEKEVLAESKDNPSGSDCSRKPATRSGLNSFLNQLGKKRKINTLEKSKLDWEQFKKDEKIEDELQAYGKSKDGYLEKQDFLQRADVRRFEIEKNIRSNLRSNRMNNL